MEPLANYKGYKGDSEKNAAGLLLKEEVKAFKIPVGYNRSFLLKTSIN